MKKLLKFQLKTCSDCKALEPVIDEVLKELAPKEVIEYEAVDAYDDFRANALHITRVPTLILFVDGVEKGRIEHMTDATSIKKLLM